MQKIMQFEGNDETCVGDILTRMMKIIPNLSSHKVKFLYKKKNSANKARTVSLSKEFDYLFNRVKRDTDKLKDQLGIYGIKCTNVYSVMNERTLSLDQLVYITLTDRDSLYEYSYPNIGDKYIAELIKERARIDEYRTTKDKSIIL